MPDDDGQDLDEPVVKIGDVLQIVIPLMAEPEWRRRTVALRVRAIRTEPNGSKTLLFDSLKS